MASKIARREGDTLSTKESSVGVRLQSDAETRREGLCEPTAEPKAHVKDTMETRTVYWGEVRSDVCFREILLVAAHCVTRWTRWSRPKVGAKTAGRGLSF